MTAARVRFELLRVHRRLVALLLVALLAVPVVVAANRLRVHVDGDVFEVLTFESTVAGLLDEQGVELAAGDEVLPGPSTSLRTVSSITVLRTIDVTLDVDGVVTPLRGTWRTVEGLLAATDTRVDTAQLLRPAARTVLHDGDTVTVTSPRVVTLTADGTTQELATHLGSVGQLLDAMGVEVGPDDLLVPSRGTEIVDGDAIVVQRVAFDEELDEVVVPFTEEVVGTGDLWIGEERITQEGVDGLEVETYRVRVVDGERAGRTLIGTEVVREPVARIVEQGTTPRPPPPDPDDGSVWYDLASCESGQRWDYDGGSGFDGGLQFHPATWRRWRPAGYPDHAWQASAQQQIEVARRLQAAVGWGAWPACRQKLGLP